MTNPQNAGAAPSGAAKAAAGAATEPHLSDDAKKAITRARSIATALGGVVSVLIQSSDYKFHTLADLEWLIGPSIRLQQFALVEAANPKLGHVMPVAAVLWAFVSPEVDARLSRELDRPIRLLPQEWKSGTIPWIVVAAGDPKAVMPLIQQLTETTFASNPPKLRLRNAEGKLSVGRLERKAS